MRKIFLLLIMCMTFGITSPTWAEDVIADDLSQESIELTDSYKNSESAITTTEQTEDKVVTTQTEEAAPSEDVASLSPVDNAFIMICAALVILMSVPGIALFYGGLVRAKNMLSILAQTTVIFSLIFILWTIYGYTLAFGENSSEMLQNIVGNLDKFLMLSVKPDDINGTLSDLTFFSFQGAFACITSCLIIGSFAERIRFSALLFVIFVWFTFAYIPLCHMVWGGGYIDSAWHSYDFAGGLVVHINAAVCALIGAYFTGKRIGYGKELMSPHNLVMTMIGACLLWVGWFGFNAGSELSPDGIAALSFANTLVAPAAAGLSWTFAEWLKFGRPSLLGACSGVVAGLVAITPACAFVSVGGALIIGLIAGVVCLWGIHGLKKILRVDDSLDVFGVHGLGGILGALLTGIFCAPELGGTGFKEGWDSILGQFSGQLVSVIICFVWTGVVSFVAFYVADKLFGVRVTPDEEREGLDLTTHGERAYNFL